MSRARIEFGMTVMTASISDPRKGKRRTDWRFSPSGQRLLRCNEAVENILFHR